MAAKLLTVGVAADPTYFLLEGYCRIPHDDFELQLGIRIVIRGHDEHGDQVGNQQAPCVGFLLRTQRRTRRAKLFQPGLSRFPELRLNDWGFNVGGPVGIQDTANPKTFFFYNMEWRAIHHGRTCSTRLCHCPASILIASGAGTGVVLPSTIRMAIRFQWLRLQHRQLWLRLAVAAASLRTPGTGSAQKR